MPSSSSSSPTAAIAQQPTTSSSPTNRLSLFSSIGSPEHTAQLDDIIKRVLDSKTDAGSYYYDMFNVEFVQNYLSLNLQRIEKLIDLHKKFTPHKGIDVIDFLYLMLREIPYQASETLFVAMAIVDFFQAVVESENLGAPSILFTHISNYISEATAECKLLNYMASTSDEHQQRAIQTKKLPESRHFNVDSTKRNVRDIDVNPPAILRDGDALLRRLTKEANCIDAIRHNQNTIISSVYSASLNQVIILDSYSDQFLVYNSDCVLAHRIRPKISQLQGQVCIDFTWSEKHQRLGAYYRDGYLIFWDASDNFTFEKVFQTGNSLNEEQTRIWYIRCIDRWITTDSRNSLHLWDLRSEAVFKSIVSSEFKGIQQLVELDQIQAVGIVTAENSILIWDMFARKQLMRFRVQHSHLITFIAFKTYAVLLTQGYDELIHVYSLNQQCNDHAHIGTLIGHQSIITAIQCVEGTPMVITTDDKFNIKVWDIRSLNCIQTVVMELKTPIKCIHVLPDSIAIVSSRLTCLLFEEQGYKSNANTSAVTPPPPPPPPVSVEFDSKKQELAVCSRSEVKYFDMNTGRLIRIVSGISTSADDEITSTCTFQQGRKFFAGNQRGRISIVSSRGGDILGAVGNHTDEVTAIRMDYLNRLVISGGADGNIYISREIQSQKTSFEKLREVYIGKPITSIELSVHHSTMAVLVQDQVYIINYEFAKLFAVFSLPTGEHPNTIEFINGYSIMLIGTSQGRILVISFRMTDEAVNLQLVAVINLTTAIDSVAPQKDVSSDIVFTLTGVPQPTQDTASSSYKYQPVRTLFDVKTKTLLVGTQSGFIQTYDLQALFVGMQLNAPSRDKANYNPYRSTKEDSTKLLISVPRFNLLSGNNKIVKEQKLSQMISIVGNKSLEKFAKNLTSSTFMQEQQAKCDGAAGAISSVIQEFNRAKSIVKAHRETIRTMKFINIGETHLITSSVRAHVKIWSYPSLELKCNLHTEHPLPIKWDIVIDNSKAKKKKFLYTLFSMKCMRQKYRRSISIADEKKYALVDFLGDYSQSNKTDRVEEKKSEQEEVNNNDVQSKHRQTEVRTMRDEYDEKDLVYEQLKGWYSDQLKGPSLRHLNEIKKLRESQNNQQAASERVQQGVEEMEAKHKSQRIEERVNEMKKLVRFFDSDYRDKVLNKQPVKELCQLFPAIDTLKVKLETIGKVEPPKKINRLLTRQATMMQDAKKKLSQQVIVIPAAGTVRVPSISKLEVMVKQKTEQSLSNKSREIVKKKSPELYAYASEKSLMSREQQDYDVGVKTEPSDHTSQLVAKSPAISRKIESKKFSNLMKSMDFKLKQSRGFAMRMTKQRDDCWFRSGDFSNTSNSQVLQNRTVRLPDEDSFEHPGGSLSSTHHVFRYNGAGGHSLQRTGSTFLKTDNDTSSVFSKSTINNHDSINIKFVKSGFHQN